MMESLQILGFLTKSTVTIVKFLIGTLMEHIKFVVLRSKCLNNDKNQCI